MKVVLGLFTALIVAAVVVMFQYEWKTSEQVAAWVQAFGSLLAIQIALAVSIWQTEKTDKERKVRARKLAQTYCGQVLLYVEELLKTCRNEVVDVQNFVISRKLLARSLQIPIDHAELSPEEIALVLTFDSIAADLLERLPMSVRNLQGVVKATMLLIAASDAGRDAMKDAGLHVPDRPAPVGGGHHAEAPR